MKKFRKYFFHILMILLLVPAFLAGLTGFAFINESDSFMATPSEDGRILFRKIVYDAKGEGRIVPYITYPGKKYGFRLYIDGIKKPDLEWFRATWNDNGSLTFINVINTYENEGEICTATVAGFTARVNECKAVDLGNVDDNYLNEVVKSPDGTKQAMIVSKVEELYDYVQVTNGSDSVKVGPEGAIIIWVAWLDNNTLIMDVVNTNPAVNTHPEIYEIVTED